MKQIVRVQIHLQALPQHSQVLLEAPTEQLYPQASRVLLLVPAVSLAFVPIPVPALVSVSVSAPYREQALVLVPVLALVPVLILVSASMLALVPSPVLQPALVPRSLRTPLNLVAARLSCVCAEALAV